MVNLERLSSVGNTTSAPAREQFLSVYVVATTNRGTQAALAAASACARDLNASIVLLVPHVVPYVQPLEHPADSPAFAGERFRDMAGTLGLDVTIRVCVCRSVSAVMALPPQDALVLVGGRRRWWRTREERLADALTRRGVRALFVDTAHVTRRPPMHSPAA